MHRVSADTEVRGELVRALTHNLRADEMRVVLKKFNVKEIDPNAWYLVSDLLAIAEEIFRVRRAADAMFDMVAMGMAATSFSPLAHQHANVREFLKMLQASHDKLYRGADTGYIKVDDLSEKHVALHLRSAWPDDLNYGNLYSWIKTVLPTGTVFKIYYDRNSVRADHGGDETIYHVEWK